MRCTTCGSRMSARRENYRYDASGLPGVTLAGVEVRRCAECGEHEVVIPSVEGLHQAIARVLIRKPERLAPAEIRFLRRYLGFSGTDFAAHVGTTPETVSRWETGAAQMGVTADRLLRLMVATRDPVPDYSLEALRAVAGRGARQFRVRLRRSGREWRAA